MLRDGAVLSVFASKGLKYWPSQANFVLFDPDQPIHQVNEKLLQQGVVVRPIPGVGKFGGIRLVLELAMKIIKLLPHWMRYFD